MVRNKIIINTRPVSPGDNLSIALQKRGAIVFNMPLIEIVPISLSLEIRLNILKNKFYDWLVFTSKNGVDNLFNQLKGHFTLHRLPFKIAVFGERTASALTELGFTPDMVNIGNTSADLLTDLLSILMPDERVLLVVGDLASELLRDGIKQSASIDRIDVYRTVFVQSPDQELLDRIKENNYDIMIFTSPSGFRSFMHHAGGITNVKTLKTACMGPTTEEELLTEGVSPLVVARPSGIGGLISGIEQYFANR